MMITSNKLFNEWGNYFGNQTVATAILDRLLHHAEAIILNGDSYRLKDTLKSN
jgi:DNA replication protein DnaC